MQSFQGLQKSPERDFFMSITFEMILIILNHNVDNHSCFAIFIKDDKGDYNG